MKRQKGFSLIELLIVVAIILIIAAIAIPNLLRARIAANESSAVSSLRTINTAEVSYTTAYPNVGYSADLVSLGTGGPTTPCGTPTSTAACFIDGVLASGSKSGYSFAYLPTGATPYSQYTVGASALTFNQSGVRNFCAVEDAVIRWLAGTAQVSPMTTHGTCNTWSALQ